MPSISVRRFGTSTITDCSDEKSTNGSTWIVLNGFDVVVALRSTTVPIGMPRGNIDGSAPLPSEPAVMIVSPTATYCDFETQVEHEHLAAAAARLDDPDGGRARQVDRGDGALAVGQQRHARDVRERAVDRADEPAGGVDDDDAALRERRRACRRRS